MTILDRLAEVERQTQLPLTWAQKECLLRLVYDEKDKSRNEAFNAMLTIYKRMKGVMA